MDCVVILEIDRGPVSASLDINWILSHRCDPHLPIKFYTLQCFVLLAQCDCQYIWEDLKPSGCVVYTAPPYGYKCICTYTLAWQCRADGILKCSEKEISAGMCRGDTEIGSCTNDCFGYSK